MPNSPWKPYDADMLVRDALRVFQGRLIEPTDSELTHAYEQVVRHAKSLHVSIQIALGLQQDAGSGWTSYDPRARRRAALVTAASATRGIVALMENHEAEPEPPAPPEPAEVPAWGSDAALADQGYRVVGVERAEGVGARVLLERTRGPRTGEQEWVLLSQ